MAVAKLPTFQHLARKSAPSYDSSLGQSNSLLGKVSYTILESLFLLPWLVYKHHPVIRQWGSVCVLHPSTPFPTRVSRCVHALCCGPGRLVSVCVVSLPTSSCLSQLPCLLPFPSRTEAEFSYISHNALLGGNKGRNRYLRRLIFNSPVVIHFYIFTVYLQDSQAHRAPVINK